ncbi:MAG: CoA transferase [Candidatus Rokubacteria bacterium]|nr:CoA transferase [Candidatus Rokubacteria bacterium]MBI3826153.1 CoA transferase [Candidatus Rokubacteria bacterium]
MLEGIRVLDLSRVIAGPYCAMLLGDLGADVIKLERPGRGDDLRGIRGPEGGVNAAFAACNRNKRGIAVDLAHPEGGRIAFELARRADVVLENFLPGTAARQGLGYDAIRAVNPGVVYASITGFGQTGPYARRAGYNLIAQGMSGLMALTGRPGDPPTRPGGSIADLAASYVAFGAVNAALVQRFRTGVGAHLDVNLLMAAIGLLPDPVAHYFDTGVRPGRSGNRNPNVTPAESFRTRDGHLILVILSPDQWDRFCRVLGDEELRTATRFATNAERLAHHAEFVTRVEAVLATAPTAAWVARFEAAQVACGPIYEFDEVFDDPHVKHLGVVTEIDQPGYGRLRALNTPFMATGVAREVRRAAPRLGEHTREVLEDLGLSAGEIAGLAAAKAIQLASS